MAKKLWLMFWITAALALIAGGAAIIAVSKSNIAQKQTRRATVSRLAWQALTMLNTNLDLALLLSVQATRMMSTPTFEAEGSLVTALEHSPSLNKVLHEHTDGVFSVAFSPDGTRLASASADKTVRLWNTNVDITSWQTRACNIANRNLTQKEWDQYIGEDVPYRCTCGGLLAGEGASPHAPNCK